MPKVFCDIYWAVVPYSTVRKFCFKRGWMRSFRTFSIHVVSRETQLATNMKLNFKVQYFEVKFAEHSLFFTSLAVPECDCLVVIIYTWKCLFFNWLPNTEGWNLRSVSEEKRHLHRTRKKTSTTAFNEHSRSWSFAFVWSLRECLFCKRQMPNNNWCFCHISISNSSFPK